MKNLPTHRHLRSATSDKARALLFQSESLAPSESLALYDGAGEPLSLATRAGVDAALDAVRAGTLKRVTFEAVTFLQRETPNRNFVRFKPGILASLAKSFVGQPFLVDHDTQRQASRAGTIVASKLEHNDDGSKQIRQRVEVVKAWAIESLLDGTIDRFSIGWARDGGVVECSIHGEDWMQCECFPGLDYAGKGEPMQLVYTKATGTETSGVNVPAVVGTGVDSIAQLGAMDPDALLCMLSDDAGHPATPTPKEMNPMDPKLAALLSLSVAATPADILTATQKLYDEKTLAEGQLSTFKAAESARVAAAAAAKVEADKLATNDKITALAAAGKILPGSPVETALRSMASRDMPSFLAQCDDILATGAQVSPVGAAPKATTKEALAGSPVASPKQDAEQFLADSPEVAASLRAAGITKEQFEKHGAKARESFTARRS